MKNYVIGVLDSGYAGNIFSIQNALDKIGCKNFTVKKPSDLSNVDKLIIPGVGNFKNAMHEFNISGFKDSILQFDRPTLGICLGMQLMAKLGFESGKSQGLGLIDAEVKPILCDDKIPHMGFNRLKILTPNPLLNGIEDDEFYFMHAYEMVNYNNILALSSYGDHSFVSVVSKENLYGVQFHPEKSREPGLKLLQNFINI